MTITNINVLRPFQSKYLYLGHFLEELNASSDIFSFDYFFPIGNNSEKSKSCCGSEDLKLSFLFDNFVH
jgi:hypothetical protein